MISARNLHSLETEDERFTVFIIKKGIVVNKNGNKFTVQRQVESTIFIIGQTWQSKRLQLCENVKKRKEIPDPFVFLRLFFTGPSDLN